MKTGWYFYNYTLTGSVFCELLCNINTMPCFRDLTQQADKCHAAACLLTPSPRGMGEIIRGKNSKICGLR